VKKSLIAILLLASFMVVIIHEIIPHHHHDMDDIELISHPHQSKKQDSGYGTDSDHHFPFPAHQHVMAAESFDIARTGTNLEISVNLSTSCFIIVSNYLYSWYKPELPEKLFSPAHFFPISSYPFIISPNAMRGSPVMA
jgi:hypothetical protein